MKANAKKKTAVVMVIITGIVIPYFTFSFASRGSMIESNLSKVGNMPGNYLAFILWGILCGVFFFLAYSFICELLGCKQTKLMKIARVASVSLILCTVCPFLPDTLPTLANLHSVAGYLAMSLTLMSTLLLSIEIKNYDEAISKKSLYTWLVHFLICLAMLILTRVSGLTEAMFVVTSSYQLCRIIWWIAKLKDEAPDEILQTDKHADEESVTDVV